jgi:hypothetical protein
LQRRRHEAPEAGIGEDTVGGPRRGAGQPIRRDQSVHRQPPPHARCFSNDNTRRRLHATGLTGRAQPEGLAASPAAPDLPCEPAVPTLASFPPTRTKWMCPLAPGPGRGAQGERRRRPGVHPDRPLAAVPPEVASQINRGDSIAALLTRVATTS